MNILFITADQWRGECLSYLDHPVVRTPNLDQLASEGALFSSHYAQSTPCSPSRASLHTGMYLHNHRVCLNGTPLDQRHTNWALEMRTAGYSPQLFGYTDTARDPRGMDPQDPRLTHYSEPLPGIETETVFKNETPQNWVEHLRQCGYPIPDYEHDLYRNTRTGVQWEDGGPVPLPLAIKTEDHETNFMVDECMKWISEQNGSWIAHLSLLRPHPPFVAPEPYNSMYNPENLDDCIRQDTVEEEAAQHPWLAYQLSRDKKRASVDAKEIRRIKASYYGLMSEVDDALGRLFDELKALGQWHDTLIVFTSDHGEQMGDHWLMGKCGYFDASYHIPLIIRDPRKQADTTRGTRFDHFTENVDIMPTMLEWLMLKQPSQCDGRSLMPLIENTHGSESWRTEVHWEVDFRNILDSTVEEALGINQHQCAMNVIRDEHFKYVHFTALPPLLFDLGNDPNEFRNHAQDPEYQSIVLHYAQKLISWRMHHDDRALTETILSEKGPVTRYSTVQ